MFDAQRLLGGPRRRWMNNVEIDVKEILWQNVEWIQLTKELEEGWSLVKRQLGPGFQNVCEISGLDKDLWLSGKKTLSALVLAGHLNKHEVCYKTKTTLG
jgi:hypothetical protein